ncbi:MAG: glycosyltransferase [Rikenellaceae bacterium]
MKNKTLVIIVTYNGMRWLERCLESVVGSSIPLDAYIVDNGSNDGSQQFITTNYPQFIFYQSPTNAGFGAANNVGLKYAVEHDYDYVYLLNQDAWVMIDTIQTMIEEHRCNPEYGILSPLQVNAGLKGLDKNFSLCCPRGMLLDSLCGNLKSLYETQFTMAAHWLISRKCLCDVGGFSPSFPHYGEDHNYVHRAIYKGYKIGIASKVFAVHDRENRVESKALIARKTLLESIAGISNLNQSLTIQLLVQPLVLLKRGLSIRTVMGFCNIFKLIYGYPKYIRNRNKTYNFAFLDIDIKL